MRPLFPAVQFPTARSGFSQSGTFSPSGKRLPVPRTHWLFIVMVIALAAVLRLYHLGASPLRGDEAFSVRYWAVPFDQALALSRVEPHPFGALFGFGLWKSLVGDSAFAMRMLPVLLNLIGVPVLYALAKRLFNDARVGYLAALLWALNPMQLYHAQDVRNYAPWAALSALTVWLLLSACDRRRSIDWLLYGVGATVALYMYFAEASFLLAGMLYVFIWRRTVWRSYLFTLTGIGIALLPWLWQGWQLAHSGYAGTAETTLLPELWTRFLPALIVGDTLPVLDELWSTLALLLLFCVLLLIRRGYGKIALFLALYTGLPALLLTIISLKIAVFRVDYLLAVTPALLLLLAYGWQTVHRKLAYQSPLFAWIMNGSLTLIFIGLPLIAFSQYQKAPDWFGVRDYLAAHVQPDDLVILSGDDAKTGAADPAFDYYYQDRTPVLTLPRNDLDLTTTIRAAADQYHAIWYMPSGQNGGLVDKALRDNMQLISDESAGRGLVMREYRSLTLKPDEIEHVRIIQAGNITLRGFSLEQSGAAVTLILYWQPGGATSDNVFVHLVGRTNPATGSSLWTQNDHPPQLPGSFPRDVYRLVLTNVGAGTYKYNVAAGTYQIMFGLYNLDNGHRSTLIDDHNAVLGDSVVLTSVVIP